MIDFTVMVKLFQKLATGLWQIIDKFPIYLLCPKKFGDQMN